MKTCSKCKEVKPLDAFYKGRQVGTLRPDCKTCCSARALENQRKRRLPLFDWKKRLEAVGVKWCSKCDTVKPLARFGSKGKRGDRSPWCHDCYNARMKERRKADPELRAREREKRKKWDAKNPEKREMYRKRDLPKRMDRDSYYAHMIAQDHIPVELVTKEMIELKRAQIHIKRLLRERNEHQRLEGRSGEGVRGTEGRQGRQGEGGSDG